MKKLAFAAVAFCLAAAPAFAQAPVNIVYPIDGGVYPITNPAPGPDRNAITSATSRGRAIRPIG